MSSARRSAGFTTGVCDRWPGSLRESSGCDESRLSSSQRDWGWHRVRRNVDRWRAAGGGRAAGSHLAGVERQRGGAAECGGAAGGAARDQPRQAAAAPSRLLLPLLLSGRRTGLIHVEPSAVYIIVIAESIVLVINLEVLFTIYAQKNTRCTCLLGRRGGVVAQVLRVVNRRL